MNLFIWLKILIVVLGIMFALGVVLASWVIFNAFMGIYGHFMREEHES